MAQRRRQTCSFGVLSACLLLACNTTKFGGNSQKRQGNPPALQPAPKVAAVLPTTATPAPCSKDYEVPATANPYLAGAGVGASLNYSVTSSDPQSPIDRVPEQSPVLVTPTDPSCFKAGAVLAFTVAGSITHNQVNQQSSADGNLEAIVSHQLGTVNGISDVTAPIDSLVGVFLGDIKSRSNVSPPPLDFSSAASRDYQRLEPKLGQVFFIGKGKATNGINRQVVVPAGAARLYFGTMDTYQWNNNVGGLRGAIMTVR